MKIRSITYFEDFHWPLDRALIRQAGDFISTARESYEAEGFEVQTTRIALPPFPLVLAEKMKADIINYSQELEEKLTPFGFDYISIGPALPQAPDSYTLIPEILSETDTIFSAGVMSAPDSGIAFKAIKSCAEIIKQVEFITPNGFTNLRFAALANVPRGSPFLPAAYHSKNLAPSFAIATEAGDLAVEAAREADGLEDFGRIFIDTVENTAGSLSQVGSELENSYNVMFAGLDFSLAPYPDDDRSVGTALQLMGVPNLGSHGTLASIAILAELIERASFRKVGFNGVMLPVLEDSSLARNAHSGDLGIKDLLLYSTVCGTGLDTIPLAGDISQEQLYAILLDLAALAQRLGKPLTARLMPIPGKLVGDETEFDFEYFENSRVMALEANPLKGMLVGDDNYHLASRSDSIKDKD